MHDTPTTLAPLWPRFDAMFRCLRPVLAVLALCALTANAGVHGFHPMPVTTTLVPITGASATVRLVLTKSARVGAFARFREDGRRTDAARLHALLGGARKTGSGAWEERGVPAGFRVTFAPEDATKRPIIVEADRPHTAAAYASRIALLAEAELDAGRYSVTVSVLAADAALNPVKVEVVLAPPHHGK